MRYHLLNVIIPCFLPPFLYALYGSCKIEARGEEYLEEVSGPVIYGGWHSMLPFSLYFYRNTKIATMASQSEDGGLIAPIFERLGFAVVRGSTGRGSVRALKQIYRLLKQGYNIGLPVDGSRGPARKVQGGTLFLAAHTGSPIIPMNTVYSHSLKFNSWDRMELPLPFSKVLILYGAPIYVPKDVSEQEFEKLRQKLENTLFRLYKEGTRALRE